MQFQGSLLQKIIFALLCIVLAAIGWALTRSGFSQVKALQEIERLPTSSVISALSGEVKLSVRVEQEQNFITSEYFKKPSVYYYYRYEEEETDSEGNRRWDTKYTSSNAIDFIASDSTGKVSINAQSQAHSSLEFSVPTSQQITRGDKRHTEWRIEPGDQLFVLGYLKQKGQSLNLGFIEPGAYIPLISKYSESEEKSNLGLGVILKVCGGISLFAFAALCLTVALGVHRILAFLFFLTISAIIPLTHLGLSMLYEDIVAASQRIQTKESAVKRKIGEISGLDSLDTASWSEFLYTVQQPSVKSPQVDGIISDYVFEQERFRAQLDHFPNNLIAWLYSVKADSLFEALPNDLKYQTEDKLKQFKKTTTSSTLAYIVGVIGSIVSLLLTWWGFKLIRLKRHIENLPTSKTSGLVFGLSELKGRVQSLEDIEPLKGPLSGQSCYWYHYKVEEKRRSGKETKWVTIENRKDYAPFLCRDQFGEVKIIPDKAEIISRHKVKERRGNRRYIESTIRLNDKVYLLGEAKIDRDVGDKLEIRYEKGSPFLITNLSEEAVMYRKANGGMLSLAGAFSALMFCALFYLGVNGSFSPTDYLLVALIAPIYMSLVVLALHYNDLVFLKQRASRNFSNISVSLQKRADLLPNLEKVVKQFMSHEKSLQSQVASLRTKLDTGLNSNQEIGELIEQEQKMLTSMIALAEDYPDLKSNKLAIKLMNKLVDLENEIALMREGFNDAVEYYNTRIATVPDVFFARSFGFKSINLLSFEAKKFQRIDVNFS